MIEIEKWMELFLQKLDAHFEKRIWFVGLQGSYSRGEATQVSDIDMVVILDELKPQDIRTYNAMLDTMPNRELICGFLSGKEEILNWEPSDLFQFCHDTKPIREAWMNYWPGLMNPLWTRPSEWEPAIFITGVSIICSMKRAMKI